MANRTPPPKLTPTLCHCVSCRKAAGAHAVGLFTVDRERTLIEGQVTEFPVVGKGCSRLLWSVRSALTYRHADWPADLSFTIATLDDPSRIAPADHTWMADAASWDVPSDGLPQFLHDRPS
jgi:hypothetical protein